VQKRGFDGDIGKSKSSYFESDKFPATSERELSEQSCPLLLHPILFAGEAALQSHRRRRCRCRRCTDDNDSAKLEKPQLAN